MQHNVGKQRKQITVKVPTPAKTQETLADNTIPKATRHGHVWLPRLSQDPAEWRQEEEMKECCNQGA